MRRLEDGEKMRGGGVVERGNKHEFRDENILN